MKKTMSILGKNLKKLMDGAKLSENELARRTGVPQQVINRIISGTNANPKMKTLLRLTDYFMISITQLIDEDITKKEISLNTKHRGWTEVTLLEWNQLGVAPIKNIISQYKNKIYIDIESKSDCFALQTQDKSMEIKFPIGTLLVFDPKKEIKNMGYILFYSFEEKETLFRQVIIKNGKTYVKCLNPKLKCFNLKLIDSNIQYYGLLIQSKFDHT